MSRGAGASDSREAVENPWHGSLPLYILSVAVSLELEEQKRRPVLYIKRRRCRP